MLEMTRASAPTAKKVKVACPSPRPPARTPSAKVHIQSAVAGWLHNLVSVDDGTVVVAATGPM